MEELKMKGFMLMEGKRPHQQRPKMPVQGKMLQMATLREMKRFLGSNETALNRSWVRPICQWWISHSENTGLCSFPLDWRENVTSVTTQGTSVTCLPAVLAYSSTLLGGISCCLRSALCFFDKPRYFLGAFAVQIFWLCLLYVWVAITRRAPRWQLWHPSLLLGSPCTTGSLFPVLSFNLPFEQYGKSQHGIFTAVLEPRYPQNTCKLNEPFFFSPQEAKYHLFL